MCVSDSRRLDLTFISISSCSLVEGRGPVGVQPLL